MPRKKATPTRFNESTSANVSRNGGEPSLLPDTELVSTESSMSCNEPWMPVIDDIFTLEPNLKDLKRGWLKKICMGSTKNHIILGSITLELAEKLEVTSPIKSILFKSSCKNGDLLEVNPMVEIAYNDTKQLIGVTYPEDVQNIMPNILRHDYHWIFKPKDETIYCSLEIDVALVISKMPIKNTRNVVEYFFKFNSDEFEDDDDEVNIDFERFFEEIKSLQNFNFDEYQWKGLSEEMKLKNSKISATIRPYQINAIQWMLNLERNNLGTQLIEPLQSLYEVFNVNDHVLYFNKYSGDLTLTPITEVVFENGGILADEMGLGKTVEVIACILNNSRNIETEDNSNYIIPWVQNEEDEDLSEENGQFNLNELNGEASSSNVVSSRSSQRRKRKSDQNLDSLNQNSDTSDEDYELPKSENIPKKTRPRKSLKKSDAADEDYQIPKNQNLEDSDTSDEDYRIPQLKQTPKRKKLRRSTKVSDIRDRIYDVPTRGEKGGLRKALNEWYEKLLGEYSTIKPKTPRKNTEFVVKCLCGEETEINANWRQDGYVKCPACLTFQHSECVKYCKQFVYFCSFCWSKQKKIKSSGTLIVSPAAISEQWVNEINKFVMEGTFKVLVYKGVKEQFIQPSVLSSYDIVIVTYDTLISELPHTELVTRKLRNEERFLKTCCPLTQIEWWRFCLDEAQMVEGNAKKTNQMVNLIQSIHRWSVTGTPLQKSLNDIYYLLEFLRIKPFCIKELWTRNLYLPYIKGNKTPLLSVLRHVFWRNSKNDVYSQIELPEQNTQYHMLHFNAVEEYFYNRLHSDKRDEFVEGLKKLSIENVVLNSLNKQMLSKVLLPLLKLRQACSHPQAVRGVFANKGYMTREKLYEYLLNKTKVETEESIRAYISSYNGLAGIHCIKENWQYAVECYRTVLRLYDEYKQNLEIDSLQIIHALHNLVEILETHPEGIPPTLRDDKLKEQALDFEKKYMDKKLEDFKQSETLWRELTSKVESLNGDIRSTQAWWLRAILVLVIDREDDDLIDKIQTDLNDQFEDKSSCRFFSAKVSSIKGIERTLQSWVSELTSVRKKSLDCLQFLKELPESILSERAVECHLRPAYNEKKAPKCELCKCEKVLLEYETQLFDIVLKKQKSEYQRIFDGVQTKGSWKFHKCEFILRSILGFSKSRISGGDVWCVEEGNIHIKMLETMKKEFKQMRAFWMELNHRAQSKDELSMSKLRLRVKLPTDTLPKRPLSLSLNQFNKSEMNHIIAGDHLVEYHGKKLSTEVQEFESTFKKKYGTLIYLKNLGNKSNATPDPCPICRIQLEEKWCVLRCGHSYCLDCMQQLSEKAKQLVKCPVCRETTSLIDICFIDLSGRNKESNLEVKGSHPTKVEFIIREIIKLKEGDESIKIVVFSTWDIVLNVLAHALNENFISYRRMPGYRYQEQLQDFKDPNLNVTVLLLPLAWGSKGLNLIEATHCFLVEPIMNPAEELQAISRIHRIGQTKKTTVHKFLMRGTIEEKIDTAVNEASDQWEEKTIRVGDLTRLFAIEKNQLSNILQ